MPTFRAKYAPGECDYQMKFHEIRWDVSNCNLACQFCWSPASRPKETGDPSIQKSIQTVIRETTKKATNPEKTFIRFTGGEPSLYWDELITTLIALGNDATLRNVPVLVQSNGAECVNRFGTTLFGI